jgi:hypothetical protein
MAAAVGIDLGTTNSVIAATGQAGHQLRQPTLTGRPEDEGPRIAERARYCGVRLSPGPRRMRVSPGWGSGGREAIAGIRVPLGFTRNKRSVAGGIPPSDAWVVMRAPAV